MRAKKVEKLIKKRLARNPEDLWAACVFERSIEVDWDNLDGKSTFEAVECHECGRVAIAHDGWGECPCGEELYVDGPMMNYVYPLVDDWEPDEEDHFVLTNSNLCLVELTDPIGLWALALTGAGMDFSWSIMKAYVLLGFLPPFWLRPPGFVESPEEHTVVLNAARRTAECVGYRLESYMREIEDATRRIEERSHE